MWLRTASQGDIAAIRELIYESCHAACANFLDAASIDRLVSVVYSAERLIEKLKQPSAEFFVVDDGEKIHGAACAYVGGIKDDAESATIFCFFVRPESKCQDVAQQLLCEVRDSFPLARRVQVHILENNQSAIEFFINNGYETLSVRTKIDIFTVIIMEKKVF